MSLIDDILKTPLMKDIERVIDAKGKPPSEKKFAENVKQLRALAAQYKVLCRNVNEVYADNGPNITRELARRREAHGPQLRHDSHDFDPATAEIVRAEFLAKRETGKFEGAVLFWEAACLARPINVHLLEIAKDLLAAEEKAERERFEAFEIAHTPSELILALQDAIRRIAARIPDKLPEKPAGINGMGNPQTLVPFIDLN